MKRARETSRKERLVSLKSLQTPRRKQGKGFLSQKDSLCRSVEHSMQMLGHARARAHTTVCYSHGRYLIVLQMCKALFSKTSFKYSGYLSLVHDMCSVTSILITWFRMFLGITALIKYVVNLSAFPFMTWFFSIHLKHLFLKQCIVVLYIFF